MKPSIRIAGSERSHEQAQQQRSESMSASYSPAHSARA